MLTIEEVKTIFSQDCFKVTEDEHSHYFYVEVEGYKNMFVFTRDDNPEYLWGVKYGVRVLAGLVL